MCLREFAHLFYCYRLLWPISELSLSEINKFASFNTMRIVIVLQSIAFKMIGKQTTSDGVESDHIWLWKLITAFINMDKNDNRI